MLNNKISLILCILLAMWNLGMSLYKEKEKRVAFVLFAAVIYLLNAFLGGKSEVNDFFADRPDGLTWLSWVVMPLVFSDCIDWMKEVTAGNVSHKLRKIVRTVLFILIAQFFDEKGAFYIALMWGLSITVILVRKGYAYVVTSGSFKKRV